MIEQAALVLPPSLVPAFRISCADSIEAAIRDKTAARFVESAIANILHTTAEIEMEVEEAWQIDQAKTLCT